MHTICADDNITLDHLATLEGYSSLVWVDVNDLARGVELRWNAGPWCLSGIFEAFVETGAMDEQPRLDV
ncbi:hypothetical protein AWENTII_003281 [Aspergillus wentii]